MYRNRPQHLGALVSTLAIVLVMHSAVASNPVPADPAAPLASSFPGPLWEVVAPKGGTATVSNAHLFLNVPGGSNHDPLRPSNQAVQVVQPTANQDFDISIKIDSEVVAADAGTSQGLIVLADDKDFITFALGTDGANISLTARTVTAGVEATLFNEAHFSEYQNPICLRLSRSGDAYTAYYSVDGVVWTEATSFTDTEVPTSVGPFAGNYNSTPAKAAPVVMVINWFDIVQ
jgi:hypothetical protein